jgi:hypothetical protein
MYHGRIITKGLGPKVVINTRIITKGLGYYSTTITYVNEYSEITNLKRSIEKYIYDRLYTIDGYAIDFSGLPFDDALVNYWFQPRLVDIRRKHYRSSSNTEIGNDIEAEYAVRIWVKKSGSTISYQKYLLRDVLMKYFKTGQSIPLYHYTGTSDLLTYIKVRDLLDDFPIPEDQTKTGYQISFLLNYMERMNKAA